jgi:hypothetical protein
VLDDVPANVRHALSADSIQNLVVVYRTSAFTTSLNVSLPRNTLHSLSINAE